MCPSLIFLTRRKSKCLPGAFQYLYSGLRKCIHMCGAHMVRASFEGENCPQDDFFQENGRELGNRVTIWFLSPLATCGTKVILIFRTNDSLLIRNYRFLFYSTQLSAFQRTMAPSRCYCGLINLMM